MHFALSEEGGREASVYRNGSTMFNRLAEEEAVNTTYSRCCRRLLSRLKSSQTANHFMIGFPDFASSLVYSDVASLFVLDSVSM